MCSSDLVLHCRILHLLQMDPRSDGGIPRSNIPIDFNVLAAVLHMPVTVCNGERTRRHTGSNHGLAPHLGAVGRDHAKRIPIGHAARRWLARIMVTWGLVAACMMFAHTQTTFYVLRFLLGVCEAGFYPDIVYYLTQWVPTKSRT